MPYICYVSRRFNKTSRELIDHANDIITEYLDQGFRLTLRQLYYQFVSRDLIANSVREYKRLGSVINDARLAGMIDWDVIEDRTREVVSNPHWSSPEDIIDSAAASYRLDKWKNQRYRPEVWIEKEALAGVIEPICRRLDISFLSCRGYTSQSEMWGSSQRLLASVKNGQFPCILHFGDHDPSGIDMSRDIRDRLEIFGIREGDDWSFSRMALNMNQVEQYQPPPNPAKTTDARFRNYQDLYGDESWELDALEPRVISKMIETAVLEMRDEKKWAVMEKLENKHKGLLQDAVRYWADSSEGATSIEELIEQRRLD